MPKTSWVVGTVIAASLTLVAPASSAPDSKSVRACQASAQYEILSDVTGGDPAEIRKLLASSPRSEDYTGPGIDILVGKCLMKGKHYKEAVAAYQHAFYTPHIDPRATDVLRDSSLGVAKAYWAMGNRAGATKWIVIAWDKSNGADEVLPFYEQFRGKPPNVISPEVKNARAYWDALSEDQRKILYDKGGERDDNSWARPCHVEHYDATNYHQVTWWYCKDDEQHSYSKAYTFLNGRLTSSYTP